MHKRLKNNNGITLISLGIIVAVVLILTGTMILNSSNRYNSQNLDKLASDLQILTEKVGIYYLENKKYPTLGDEEDIVVNDTTVSVYKIDLTQLDGLTLNFGDLVNGEDDYYTIDTSIGLVYYKRGIDGMHSLAQFEKVSGVQVLQIEKHPEWNNAKKGNTVKFNIMVNIDGVENIDSYLSYQWYKNNKYDGENSEELLDDENKIIGANTAEITINNVTIEDIGYYYCVVTYNNGNEIKRKSNVAKLDVRDIEVVWTQTGSTITDGTVTLHVGDYVAYEPQKEVLSYEMPNTYTGYTTNMTYNQDNLNWRVLGVTQDGKLELVSESVTSQQVYFAGYQGYNNLVYLIDEMCDTLYRNDTNSTTGRGLKKEDIVNVVNESVRYRFNGVYERIYYAGYCPTIVPLEIGQEVDEVMGSRYGQSEQDELIEVWGTETRRVLGMKQNYMPNTILETELIDYNDSESKYFDLFGYDSIGNSLNYLLASRCVHADDLVRPPGFGVLTLEGNKFEISFLVNSDNVGSSQSSGYLRPVVTLGSSIEIDTTDITRDGQSIETAWKLK